MTSRLRKLIGLAGVTLTCLPACGSGSGSEPSPTPTPTPGNFAIVGDRTAGALTTLEINASTGALTSIGSTPVPAFPTIMSAAGLAVDPRGRYVYFSNGRSVVSFSVDHPTGRLTERGRVDLTRLGLTGEPSYLNLHASERHVHQVNQIAGNYRTLARWRAVEVDPNTGALGHIACNDPGCDLPLPNTGGTGTLSVAIPTPAGSFTHHDGDLGLSTSTLQADGSFVDMGTLGRVSVGAPKRGAMGQGLLALADEGGNLQTFAADAATGALSPWAQALEVFGPYTGCIDPSPRLAVSGANLIALVAYDASCGTTQARLQIWRVSRTGALEKRTDLTRPVGASSPAFDPTGRFLYVTNDTAGIDAYAVAADGTLAGIGHYPFGNGPIVTLAR